jgi:hypothetical protein
MYIRFVIQKKDKNSGRRQGLFQAMAALRDEGTLLPHDLSAYEEIYEWFKKNLKKPRSFTRSLKPHAKKVSLSWFKDTATEHIAKMYALVQILESHGVTVDVIRTQRPGYVVYDDPYQVAAEPFSETVT